MGMATGPTGHKCVLCGEDLRYEKEHVCVYGDRHPDPWAHRSKGMRCDTCMWFVVKVDPPGPQPAGPQKGRCRRHAPTMSGYPVVFGSLDFCGDHKLA